MSKTKSVLEITEFLNQVLEKMILKNLGFRYEIDCLKRIDQFLEPRNTLLLMDDLFIELSDSPYINVKEIARKLPECFGDLFASKLSALKQEDFDTKFNQFIQTIEESSFATYGEGKISELFNDEDFNLNEIYKLLNNC